MLWQPLVTKTNDYTSSKSLNMDIKWEVHKRTRQEVFAKLESYIYKVYMVHATNNYACPYVHATTSCLSHSLLKATMLYIYALSLSFQILPPCSRPMMSHHVTCHVNAVSHASLLSKIKENQYKSEKIKEKKNKIVSVQASYNNTLRTPC